jgi:pSer/pThr/pTyr-binding forkhead associated (FHA) protein
VKGSTPGLTIAPLRQALAGACGGMLTFILLEPRARAADLSEGGDVFGGVILLGLLFGGIVAGILTAADEMPSGRPMRIIARGLLAAVLGAILGVIASVAANILYAILMVMTRLAQGGLGWLIVARTLGWGLFGAGAGVAAGLPYLAARRISQGSVGGLIGGLAGGFLFDLIALATQSQTATISRLVGFTAVAALVGLATSLVQELARVAWLTFHTGAREGRQVILHRNVVLGRDELVDVPLFGDPSVGRRQAEILLTPAPYIRETGETPLLRVNGQPVREAPLGDGSLIELGRHRMHFHHRTVAAVSGAPLPPAPAPAWGAPVPSGEPAGYRAMPPRHDAAPPTWLGSEPPPSSAYPAAPGNAPQSVSSDEGAGPVLRFVAGPNAGMAVSLGYEPCTLGREADNTLALADARASRRHAQIRYLDEEEAWVLEDLGSTNGTQLNGLRVSRAALAPGDMIQIGETVIAVEPSTAA